MQITNLYKFPIKGFTPKEVRQIDFDCFGNVQGDRVFGFLLNKTELDATSWLTKRSFLTLQGNPLIAKFNSNFDEAKSQLHISLNSHISATADIRKISDRIYLSNWLREQLLEIDSSIDIPPFTLIGDGHTYRFHDREQSSISIMSTSSLKVFEETAGIKIDERRFRMNITIDGLDPWQELDLIGSAIRINNIKFNVIGPVVRCLATHVNPDTGERDCEVMSILTKEFSQERPVMGVLAVPVQEGTVSIGDRIDIV